MISRVSSRLRRTAKHGWLFLAVPFPAFVQARRVPEWGRLLAGSDLPCLNQRYRVMHATMEAVSISFEPDISDMPRSA